jgi:threonine/homoserine/homoserine lactone efflux protein
VDPLLLAYFTFTFILVITPGSTTAVVIRNTLSGGRAAGFAAAAGAALGNTSHATAAGLGLAVVFARWPIALLALRIGGALYLVWLGASSLYRAVAGEQREIGELGAERTAAPSTITSDDADRTTAPRADGGISRSGSFRQGLTVNLLNPSIATFYLVVVPTFLPSGAPRGYFVLFAALHVAMAFACHGMWALALDTLRHFFRRPHARRALEAATGVALLALALRIVLR